MEFKVSWFKIILLILLLGILIAGSIFTYKYKNPIFVSVPTETKIIQLVTSTSTEPSQKRLDLPTIIQKWYPGVVRVECYIKDAEEKINVQSGSGLLIKNAGNFFVLTNKHVLSLNNSQPELCAVGLANSLIPYVAKGQPEENSEPEIYISPDGLDWGYIKLTNPESNFQEAALENVKFCKQKPTLGTGIVIMGYPEVGSQTDITVTQGIISGYETPYFITDAKIGCGNSGGVAIQTSDDPTNSCMLGIPTFTQIGDVVNLGRILDTQLIQFPFLNN